MNKANPEKKVGRPRIRLEEPAKSSQKGLKPGDERINVVTTSAIIEDLKNIAYIERLMLKDVYNDAFAGYIAEYKSNNPDNLAPDGNVKVRPANA